jgi:transposase-like protein
MDSMGRRDGASPPRPGTANAIRQASGTPGERPKKATKRVYDAEFKLRVLCEVEQLGASGDPGAQGAFIRREGITWSHVQRWRRERDKGGLAALARKKRGPKPSLATATELEQLRRRNARLEAELRKAEIIIDVQKKLAALLGAEVPVPTDEEEP